MKNYIKTYKEKDFSAKVSFERSKNIDIRTHIIYISYSNHVDLTKCENKFANFVKSAWVKNDELYPIDKTRLMLLLDSAHRFEYSEEFKQFVVDNSKGIFAMNNFV